MREQTSALEAVIAAKNPLDAFWELQSNWAQTALGVEFVALSNHRKGLRSVLAGVTDEARSAQGRALEALSEAPALDPTIPSAGRPRDDPDRDRAHAGERRAGRDNPRSRGGSWIRCLGASPFAPWMSRDDGRRTPRC